MKYLTDTVSIDLTEKLKEKGMPMTAMIINNAAGRAEMIYETPTFASTFDWLMSRGFACEVYGRASGYDYVIVKECNDATRGTNLAHNNYEGPNGGACWDTWYEAAEAAIKKTLKLI